MSFFGNSTRRRNTLAGRVKKLERKVAKKERIAGLKRREETLRKKLRGF